MIRITEVKQPCLVLNWETDCHPRLSQPSCLQYCAKYVYEYQSRVAKEILENSLAKLVANLPASGRYYTV